MSSGWAESAGLDRRGQDRHLHSRERSSESEKQDLLADYTVIYNAERAL